MAGPDRAPETITAASTGQCAMTTAPVLFRQGLAVADHWVFPADGEPVPPHGAVALPKTRLLAEWVALAGRSGPLGVVLASGEKLDGLEQLLPRLTLVKLVIPRYADGRLYSIARLLRDRYGFSGEVRAAGDILSDQVPLLLRAGVDAFEVTHQGTIRAISEHSIIAVRHHYQPASNEAAEQVPMSPGARPWLRRPAPAA